MKAHLLLLVYYYLRRQRNPSKPNLITNPRPNPPRPSHPGLNTNSMTKHARSELAEQAGPVALRQLLKHGEDAFPLGVADSAEAVAGDGAGDEASTPNKKVRVVTTISYRLK